MAAKYKSDAVFEGGGVKGIGLLGALSEMEKTWEWENLAGTSAGAIVAAFTAVGMSSAEIRSVLDKVDMRQLMDEAWEDKLDRFLATVSLVRFIPKFGDLSGHVVSLLKDFGMYEGDRFEEIVRNELPKDARTFSDILYDKDTSKASAYRYKLRVVASDITANRMIVLPQDIANYGEDPDSLEIARALRMSMSIPIFFEPVKVKNCKTGQTHLIVDGGILSNYPIWLFDAPLGEEPGWPTFGFNLYSPADKGDGLQPWPAEVKQIKNTFGFAKSIWDTMFSAIDQRYIAKRHWARTVAIDNLGVSTTDFNLGQETKDALWNSGVKAAKEFMTDWGEPQEGFARWKREYRGDVEQAQTLAKTKYGYVR